MVDNLPYPSPPREHGNNLSPIDVEYNSGEGSNYNKEREEDMDKEDKGHKIYSTKYESAVLIPMKTLISSPSRRKE